MHDLKQVSVRRVGTLTEQMSEVDMAQNIFQTYSNTNSVFLRFQQNSIPTSKLLEAVSL